ncbi:MAG: YfhO family protein [Bacteroidales bacterium]
MNMNNLIKIFKPTIFCLAVILAFFISTLIYFSPLLEGKQLQQHDIVQYKGMSKELRDYRKETGEEAIWTNSMFSGMPGYLISTKYDNLIKKTFTPLKNDMKHPNIQAFMYFLCFFIALLLLKIPIGLSMLGALFYGFSSYFFIIIDAGHYTKSLALGYMPVIIAGVVATYKGNKWLGSVLFAFFLSLQLTTQHFQITYYTVLIILFFVLIYGYKKFKTKEFIESFIKPSLFLLVAVSFAALSNISTLYMTYDYGKDTMRGESELSHNKADKTSGLNKSYALSYSYGIDETFNLLIPNYKGGASQGELPDDSHMEKALKQNRVPQNQIQGMTKQAPLYWGDQSSTSGPVYIGAVVIFLFIFALFIVTGPVKWWLLSATIFSIMVAWGNNFMMLLDPMLDYLPGFNKFRTVSMILVIAQFCIPLLAIFGLQKFFYQNSPENKKDLFKKLQYSLYITGGLILLLIFTADMHSFKGNVDQQLQSAWPDWLIDALRQDRKSLLISDAWRSLGFVVATFAVLTAYHYKKITLKIAISFLVILTILDLWQVDKRYLNDDDFVKTRKNQQNQLTPTKIDSYIKQDTALYYRVMNFNNPFNDAVTSYHHKSIGGYHGAKLQRYQDLIDFHLSKMNMDVLNMLNAKYFIIPDRETGKNQVQKNTEALGNAWFVEKLSFVPNPDAEIEALNSFNPAKKAITDIEFKDDISDTVFTVNSSANIDLTEYEPNYLRYAVSNNNTGFAVFSEIYYPKGWNAYIDGEFTPHFRVNYVLRALEIPAGKHIIEFKFEPRAYYITNTISLISSIILIIILLAIFIVEIKKYYDKHKETVITEQ